VCLKSSLESVSTDNSSKFSWKCDPGRRSRDREGSLGESGSCPGYDIGGCWQMSVDWNSWPFRRFAGQVPVGRLVPCCLPSHASEYIVCTARGKQQAANVADIVPRLCE